MLFEDKLIYFPTRFPDGHWAIRKTCVDEGDIFPSIEDCNFATSDRIRLHGWYCTPLLCQSGKGIEVPAKTVFLWFHGNAGNISYRYDMIRKLMSLRICVFIVDYRGYGKSEGSPTESGLYLDAQAAWDYLTIERGVEPHSIIILGKSLGGVPAIDLATRVSPAGLIVQSSFTSAADVAATIMPFLPRMLLHTKMNSLSKIRRVECPKLFIHSRADEVIPFELGHKLFEAASEPKEFYEVKGAPHNSTYLVGGAEYLAALRRFIDLTQR